MGTAAQVGQKVHEHGPAQLDPPCPRRRLAQPHIAGPVARNADFRRDDPDDTRQTGVGIRGDVDGHDVLFRGAQNGQRPVRRDCGPFFRMVEVVRKFRTHLFLALVHLGGDQRLGLHKLAQAAQQSGVFAQLLGQNIARAGQRILFGLDGFGQIPFGQRHGLCRTIRQNRTQQRLQPVFTRDHRLGAPFGFERQVQILKHRFGVRPGNVAGQRVGQFALACDFGQDAGAALFEIAQVVQTFGQLAQLRVVQPACHLFAVTRDKGHRVAAIQQGNGRRHLFGPRVDVGGDGTGNAICNGGHGGDSFESRTPVITPQAFFAKPRLRLCAVA